jgi:hypothetical protein
VTTPYNPNYVPTTVGTATFFPVKEHDVSDPTLAKAVNALFFSDADRWPTTYSATSPYAAGSKVPLNTQMVDCPDANAVANWLAFNDTDQEFIPGASYWGTLPTIYDGTHDDASGTTPYVNPSTSTNPDAIYALNYLLDNSNLL